MKTLIALIVVLTLAGCASTAPVNIGGGTYYSSKLNGAGVFGDPASCASELMVEGNAFCAKQKLQFQLVTQSITPNIVGVQLGGANITFRCVEQSQDPTMRKDNGVTTIENR